MLLHQQHDRLTDQAKQSTVQPIFSVNFYVLPKQLNTIKVEKTVHLPNTGRQSDKNTMALHELRYIHILYFVCYHMMYLFLQIKQNSDTNDLVGYTYLFISAKYALYSADRKT